MHPSRCAAGLDALRRFCFGSTNRNLILLVAFTLSLGCGGSEGSDQDFVKACGEVPGCDEDRSEQPASRETIWRVLVVRDASGRVSIDHAEPLEVIEGTGVPLGRLAGSHLLVGFDRAGNAVDAQLIAFPTVLRGEMANGWSEPVQIDLTRREVDTVGYLRAEPGVVKLAVVDPEGREVASMEAPSPVADAGGHAAPFIAAALAVPARAQTQSRQLEGVPPHCAHVQLLQGERDRLLAKGIAFEKEDSSEKIVELLVPGPTQRAVVRGALGLMTPLLCHGISRIAIGSVTSPDGYGVGGIVSQLSTGDLMLLNVEVGYSEQELAASEEARLRMMHTLIHEAAHATEALLNAEGSRPEVKGPLPWSEDRRFQGDWQVAARAIADETIARVRLEKSLIQEWKRTHQSFVNHGWAQNPAKAVVREWSAKQVTEGGFMSRYGGTNYADDIADMVAWSYMGDHYRAAGIPEGRRQTEDYSCQEMRRHGEKGLPARFAAVYTKLMFLKDLGLVTAEDAERCTGSSLGLPVERPGFHVWQGTVQLRSFDGGVTAGIGTTEGRRVFQMQAEGEATFGEKTYPATMRLQLDLEPASVPLNEVPWPRGVYELGLLGTNRFTLRLDGAQAGDFNVHEGYVLVAEASNERIVGSVFMRVAFRPHAPLPVPQTFDPPLAVRFLIEK